MKKTRNNKHVKPEIKLETRNSKGVICTSSKEVTKKRSLVVGVPAVKSLSNICKSKE